MKEDVLFEIFELKNKIIIPNKELDSKLTQLMTRTSGKYHIALKQAYNILKEPILRKEYRERGDSSMEINSILNWQQIDEMVKELQLPASPPTTPTEYANESNQQIHQLLPTIQTTEANGLYQLVEFNYQQQPNLQPQQPQPDQVHNGPEGQVTSILNHRVRYRNSKAEIKFLSVRQGLEMIDPKWEKMELVIENGQKCLMEYLNNLQIHHKRQFQNIMFKFTEVRRFYMSNKQTK